MAEPVWDYGGKSALGVRFEGEGKAELERGGTHGFGFPTETLVEAGRGWIGADRTR